MINGEAVNRSTEDSELCKILFSRNVLFLRTYLGFSTQGAPYDQIEFANLIGVSAAGLRRWEAAEVIPNELSLRAICNFANLVLKTPIPIENAHLLYRNLVTELTLLRMGSHNASFQNLSSEQQRQFASFLNNNMDLLLDYFMQETQESQINYHIMLENALVGVYLLSKDKKVIYANQALRDMTGYSQKDIEEINIESIVHPDDLEDSKRRIKERLSGKKKNENYIFRLLNKNGHFSTCEVFSSRVISQGEPAILGVVLDITERLEAEKALQESEENYRQLFNKMFTAFAVHEVITDKTGKPVNYRFLDVNPAFEKMTGLNAKDVIGKTVREVLPNTESYWIEKFGNVALTGIPDSLTEYSQELDKYYEVHGYSPKKGQFAVTFVELPKKIERKKN
jgi:PAS domain S-box-containing protein